MGFSLVLRHYSIVLIFSTLIYIIRNKKLHYIYFNIRSLPLYTHYNTIKIKIAKSTHMGVSKGEGGGR